MQVSWIWLLKVLSPCPKNHDWIFDSSLFIIKSAKLNLDKKYIAGERGELDKMGEMVVSKLMGNWCIEQENVKNAEIYGGGGPNIGNILRSNMNTPDNQGKGVWQTNEKKVENYHLGDQS